ncbi:Protachykinin-1 [Tupaia chinensis]|uniref:Protachykinin-1 n=1 Tax=Tupaia chinensis TaxID=246437 RepID=L9JEW5_TUPCH|nr:Protachykinin-1 [Tupaia chinensis]
MENAQGLRSNVRSKHPALQGFGFVTCAPVEMVHAVMNARPQGKSSPNKRWLVLSPAQEVEVVLETSVVIEKVVLVVMTTLVMEETSVVVVALMAAIVVVDTAEVGIAIMDLGFPRHSSVGGDSAEGAAAERGPGERFPHANAPLCLPPAGPGGLKKSDMKILVALAVFFLVSSQLFAEEIGANDDLNYWSDWSDSDQIKEELPEPFEHLLQRIARRPKPQQFFGLMGKRDADSSIEKQVALLKALYVGYERSAMQNYERRRK